MTSKGDWIQGMAGQLEASLKHMQATASIFGEEDFGYAPKDGLYTVAGHIAHAADSVDWFVAGAFGDGWNMDFDAMIKAAKEVGSLARANEWLVDAYRAAAKAVRLASAEELLAPIPDTRIMAGAPRLAIVGSIMDHTAHHRGALAVYARLLDREPPMPYA